MEKVVQIWNVIEIKLSLGVSNGRGDTDMECDWDAGAPAEESSGGILSCAKHVLRPEDSHRHDRPSR